MADIREIWRGLVERPEGATLRELDLATAAEAQLPVADLRAVLDGDIDAGAVTAERSPSGAMVQRAGYTVWRPVPADSEAQAS